MQAVQQVGSGPDDPEGRECVSAMEVTPHPRGQGVGNELDLSSPKACLIGKLCWSHITQPISGYPVPATQSVDIQ